MPTPRPPLCCTPCSATSPASTTRACPIVHPALPCPALPHPGQCLSSLLHLCMPTGHLLHYPLPSPPPPCPALPCLSASPRAVLLQDPGGVQRGEGLPGLRDGQNDGLGGGQGGCQAGEGEAGGGDGPPGVPHHANDLVGGHRDDAQGGEAWGGGGGGMGGRCWGRMDEAQRKSSAMTRKFSDAKYVS